MTSKGITRLQACLRALGLEVDGVLVDHCDHSYAALGRLHEPLLIEVIGVDDLALPGCNDDQ